jgi:predicted transcriptional regulator
LKNKASKILLYEIMARDVITVKPTDNLDYYGIDEYKRIRHLPVLENNAVLGVISIGDVVKSIIEFKRNNSVFGFLY